MTNEELIRYGKDYLHDLETACCSISDTHKEFVREAIKALEQQTNDCKIFGTKENCFGGATENECEHCDYKIQKLEQHSEDCVSRQAVDHLCFEYLKSNTDDNIAFYEHFRDLPPVTPTFPKGATNGI